MAGSDPQKQLLNLIRDFATEKSQGERRVASLKKRIQELQSEQDIANTELEDAKCSKEITEQELKGTEVELALNAASIQALETRTSLIQAQISNFGSDVEALKIEEGVHRDEFISQMLEFNKKIRKFQESIACTFHEGKSTEPSSDDGDKVEDKQATLKIQIALREVEDELAHMISQTHTEEQNMHKVKQELVDLERQASLLEAIVKEMKELHELTRQTTESEEACTTLGEKLQAKCACPVCHLDNVGTLGGILQADQGI